MTHIEILESRIAPAAVYLVSSISKNVTLAGENAENSANETAAMNLAGANAAIFLEAGDRIVFDADEVFDFNDSGSNGYQFNTTDAAIDGLVVVRDGGYDTDSIRTTPLKLVLVPALPPLD